MDTKCFSIQCQNCALRKSIKLLFRRETEETRGKIYHNCTIIAFKCTQYLMTLSLLLWLVCKEYYTTVTMKPQITFLINGIIYLETHFADDYYPNIPSIYQIQRKFIAKKHNSVSMCKNSSCNIEIHVASETSIGCLPGKMTFSGVYIILSMHHTL